MCLVAAAYTKLSAGFSAACVPVTLNTHQEFPLDLETLHIYYSTLVTSTDKTISVLVYIFCLVFI